MEYVREYDNTERSWINDGLLLVRVYPNGIQDADWILDGDTI